MDLLEKTHYFRRALFHQQVQVADGSRLFGFNGRNLEYMAKKYG